MQNAAKYVRRSVPPGPVIAFSLPSLKIGGGAIVATNLAVNATGAVFQANSGGNVRELAAAA